MDRSKDALPSDQRVASCWPAAAPLGEEAHIANPPPVVGIGGGLQRFAWTTHIADRYDYEEVSLE